MGSGNSSNNGCQQQQQHQLQHEATASAHSWCSDRLFRWRAKRPASISQRQTAAQSGHGHIPTEPGNMATRWLHMSGALARCDMVQATTATIATVRDWADAVWLYHGQCASCFPDVERDANPLSIFFCSTGTFSFQTISFGGAEHGIALWALSGLGQHLPVSRK